MQAWTDAARTMLRATYPHTLKLLQGAASLELAREWRQARRAQGLPGVLVLRYVTSDTEPLADLPRLTRDALRAFAGFQALAGDGIAVILEVPVNERFHTDPADFAALARASLPAASGIKAAGFTPGVLVTSEGNPPGDQYGVGYFLQRPVLEALLAFRAMGAVWCPHGYSHPPAASDDAYHATRPARILRQLPAPARLNYLYGEDGCDGGCDLPDKRPGQGWRSYFGSAREYADWYRAKSRAIAADPLCVGSALFLCGADPASRPPWDSFDIADERDLRDVLREDVPGPAMTWLQPIGAPVPTTPPPTTEEVPMLRGIDVSNNNGQVDLAAAKAAGYAFVAIKASGDEGGGDNVFHDAVFPGTWRAAGAQELVRIAYHYARPSVVGPARSVTTLQEALAAAGGLGPGDGIALDVEDPAVPDGVSLHVWVAEWLDLAARVLGVPPWKYSARYYTSTHDLEHDDLAAYPTWWASYQSQKPAPVTGWGPILIWQHDAHTTVPGVAGECDVDLFYGTVDDLRALGKPAEVVEPGDQEPRHDNPSAPPEVIAALDSLWSAAGPDVAKQTAIVGVKVAFGLQEE